MINNMEYDTNIFRFSIKSLSLPESIYDFNLDNDIQTLKKEKKVGGNLSSESYTSTRFMSKVEMALGFIFLSFIEKTLS